MYKGRFAPSPTGPLHFGSLVTALASFLDARANGGIWQLRFDDIDPPRHDPLSFTSIPNCLEQHGLCWDNDVIMQSERRDAHESYIGALKAKGLVFVCRCTRATLGPLGQCDSDCSRCQYDEGSQRLRLTGEAVDSFIDLALGYRAPDDMPDNFVIKRRDGLIAYQLATAVDDIDEGYTHIVRGSDLLNSTFRQTAVHKALGKSSPQYGHLPLVTDSLGNKLSKQSGATAVDASKPVENLRSALGFLNQPSPQDSCKTVKDLLEFATEHWDLALIKTSHPVTFRHE